MSSLDEILRRSQAWLQDSIERLEQQLENRPRAACNLLLGLWVIASVHPSLASTMRSNAGKLRHILENSNVFSVIQQSPAIALICSGIFDSMNLRVPILCSFTDEASRLLACEPEDHDRIVNLYEKRAILNSMGLLPAPRRITIDDLDDIASRQALPASRGHIEEFICGINSFTAYGTEENGEQALSPSLRPSFDLLHGLAISALRNYDLELGCQIIRALTYVRTPGDGRFRVFSNFVALHQQLDGSFGFFAPELRDLGPDAELSTDFSTNFQIPLTVDCLVTILEVESDWRLLNCLPKREC